MGHPWAQRSDESPEAFEAFRVYRDLGADRSHVKVAQEIGKSRSLISKWSSQHDWVDRAAAWDHRADRARQKANLDEIVAMSRRHAAQAVAGQVAIDRINKEFLRRVKEEPESLREMPLEDLVQALHRALRNLGRLTTVEREARGLPTAWLKISQMDDDELHDFTTQLLAEGEWAGSDDDPLDAFTKALEA